MKDMKHMKRRKSALLIGRFQPFHLGHLKQVERIVKDYSVLIAIGSAQYSHTVNNPFTAGERIQMISETLRNRGIDAIIVPIDDVHRHSVWVSHVVSMLPPFDIVFTNEPLTKQLFKEMGYEVRWLPFFRRNVCSGTVIRKRMALGKKWEHLVPLEVAKVIKDVNGDRRLMNLANDDRGHEREGMMG